MAGAAAPTLRTQLTFERPTARGLLFLFWVVCFAWVFSERAAKDYNYEFCFTELLKKSCADTPIMIGRHEASAALLLPPDALACRL